MIETIQAYGYVIRRVRANVAAWTDTVKDSTMGILVKFRTRPATASVDFPPIRLRARPSAVLAWDSLHAAPQAPIHKLLAAEKLRA